MNEGALAFLNQMAESVKPLRDSVIQDIKLFRENVQYYWDQIYPEAEKWLSNVNKKNIYNYIDTYMATDLTAFVFIHLVVPYAIRTISGGISGALSGIQMGVSYLGLLIGWHTAPYSAPPQETVDASEQFLDNLYRDVLAEINREATQQAIDLKDLASDVAWQAMSVDSQAKTVLQSLYKDMILDVAQGEIDQVHADELNISTLSEIANDFAGLGPEWIEYSPFELHNLFRSDTGVQTQAQLIADAGMQTQTQAVAEAGMQTQTFFEDYTGPPRDGATQTYTAVSTGQTQTEYYYNMNNANVYPANNEPSVAHAFVIMAKILRKFGYSTDSGNVDSSEEEEIAYQLEALFWQTPTGMVSLAAAGGGYLFYASAFLLQFCAGIPGYPVYYFLPSAGETMTMLAYNEFYNWMSGERMVVSEVLDDLRYIVDVGTDGVEKDMARGIAKNLTEFVHIATEVAENISVETGNAVRVGTEILSGSWFTETVRKVTSTIKGAQNSIIIAVVAVGVSVYFLAR